MSKQTSLTTRKDTAEQLRKAHFDHNKPLKYEDRISFPDWLDLVSLGKITIPKKQ